MKSLRKNIILWLGQIGIAGLLAVVLINHSFPLLSPQSAEQADPGHSARSEQSAPAAPEAIIQEANLWNSGRSDFAGSAGEDRKLGANGWGGGASDDAEPFDEPEPEPEQGADAESGESDWGIGG